MAKIRLSLLQHTHQIPLHILVDFAITSKGAAAFFVAAEGTDEIRILDLFVEISHKATACKVRGSDLIERTDFLFICSKIKNHHRASQSCFKEHLLDGNIVFLLGDQWQ